LEAVAARAGVSRATASRVVNGQTTVAPHIRDAVLRAIDEYHPGAVVVLDVDIGHTDPQLVLPHGGEITVDAMDHRITVSY
jgi:muramoyltetrapeptide carboxypeptidase LdcA involved in peptidoglycan recycling